MARSVGGIYTLPAGSTIANGDLSSADDLNIPLADIEADLNLARPIVAGGTGATTAADARTNLGFTLANLSVTATAAQINTVGQLAGRNLIINGQGRINQRVYVSGTNTSGANEYTLDRWRVVTSGQNLAFTGTDAKRTMTAPAGGCEQVIEGASIEGGTYVINWTGTATCTVDGVSRAKGDTFTLTANTNATVRFIGGTFTDVQVELGSLPTTFERLPFGDELARCQRYYEKSYDLSDAPGTATNDGSHGFTASAATFQNSSRVKFSVRKRTTPSISIYNTTTGSATTIRDRSAAGDISYSGIDASETAVGSFTGLSPTPSLGNQITFHWVADAEL